MREICICLQYLGIFFLIIELVYILHQWPSRRQSYLLFLAVATLINSIGYLFEITAANVDVALIGTQLSYIGKVYIPLLTLLFTADYCRGKLPRTLTNLLFLFHSVVLLLVFTCKYHSLYYTEIGFEAEGVFPHIVLGHGPVYKLNMAVWLLYIFAIPVICLRRYKISKDASEKRRILSLLLMVLLPSGGLIVYLLGVTQGYDTTAVCYVIANGLLLFAIFRNDFFAAVNLAKDHIMESLADGLVVVGPENELVYTNPPAQKLYPSLMTEDYYDALEDIKKHTESRDEICSEGKVYVASKREILYKNMPRANMYLLKDITAGRNYTERLRKEVEEKTKEIKNLQHSVIVSFANMIEERDGITGLHIKHTSAYVGIVARALQKKEEYREQLSDTYVTILTEAAPLHDIGKIAMPDAILMKPGKLTEEEIAVIKTHAERGAKIIEEILNEVGDSDYLKTARDMARCHHEKWDGSGYPNALKGEEIPLCARIMAVADVYDALRSKRSYKDEFPLEKAKTIIQEGAGTHFDPEVAEVFLENIREIEKENQAVL